MERFFLPNKRELRKKKVNEKWGTIIALILKQQKQNKILKHYTFNQDFFKY
jgi:hypothetical protein